MTEQTDIYNVAERIGNIIHRHRLKQGLGAGELADKAGISRYTLSQIEKGGSNPTVDTLWKIADGLHLPFASLMAQISNDCDVSIKRSEEIPEVKSPDSAFAASPIFGHDTPAAFDTYIGTLQPLQQYESQPHRKGVVELLTVMEGCVEVEIDGSVYRLDKHDSMKFRGDRSHIYRNPGDRLAHIHFVIYY